MFGNHKERSKQQPKRAALLGQKVEDIVTGLTGITTARTEYLNGCVRYLIQPQCQDNKPATDVEWVDWNQIRVIDDGVRSHALKALGVDPEAAADQPGQAFAGLPTGGPRADAPRR